MDIACTPRACRPSFAVSWVVHLTAGNPIVGIPKAPIIFIGSLTRLSGFVHKTAGSNRPLSIISFAIIPSFNHLLRHFGDTTAACHLPGLCSSFSPAPNRDT
jgi:hypothetical protein